MYEFLLGMKADMEMLKTTFGNSIRVGPVEVVDAKRGYRIKIADGDDGPVLSPWYPHPESGGQTSSWMPISKGQIIGVMHPAGDQRQGVIIRAGFSGDNPQPSEDLALNLLEGLGVKFTVKDGTVTVEGNFVLKGNMHFQGDSVRHNEKNIGDDHRHKGVIRGAENTLEPV